MGSPESKREAYDGYEPYQFLEAGVDYDEFEMVEEMHVAGDGYRVPLSEAEEERVRRLNEEHVVFSAHDHPLRATADAWEMFEWCETGRTWYAYEFLADGNVDAIFDNLLHGYTKVESKSGETFEDVVYDLGTRLADLRQQEFFVLASNLDDVCHAHEEGKVAVFPGIESSALIDADVDKVDVLHGLGIQMMGIAYNEANRVGTGLKEPRDMGLTRLGVRVVDRMNKLGMAIDLSHASDQTCLDTCDVSSDPVFVSHAGARQVWETNRMKPDEVIEAVAETGGVVGVEAAPHTTLSRDHTIHTIESVMDHFEYVVDLVGIDHVTFGPDVLFGDHVELHHVHAEEDPQYTLRDVFESETTARDEDHEEVEYVKGMENPVETWHNIVRVLVKRGYSEEEIAKVVGGNLMAALEEVY